MLDERPLRLRGWLALEHVECCGGDVARVERVKQCLLVNDPTARAVDDPGAWLHRGEAALVDEPACLIEQRHVDREEVGTSDALGRRGWLDVELAGGLLREHRVVPDDRHAECLHATDDFASDAPEAEHAEGLAVKLDAHEVLALPLALLHRAVALRHIAGHGHDEGAGVLGSGDRVASRCVHHHHAGARRGVAFDVVHARPSAPDDLELACRLNDGRRHLRAGAHHQAVVVLDEHA
mmetsp:Transcript_44891/g.111259  ORF Transcript_44891/g.111259 Transcript_44891/m.111259 type:complete len:237 (-) Transcript_44891:171-881(-)